MRCSRTFVDTADSKRGALVIIIEVIFDALFAAVASVGFSAISDPPTYAFSRIAVLAALGHALRFVLIKHGFDIATASFISAFVVGFASLVLARRITVPMTVLYVPALLPMVPGIYAYKSVLALIMFLQSLNDAPKSFEYLHQFFSNATVSVMVVVLLTFGAALPTFIFRNMSLALSRPRSKTL